jgi:putative transposase
VVTPKQRRAAVTHLVGSFPTSERRACRVIGLARSRWQHVSRRPSDGVLRARLRELAMLRPRWGYQRLHVLLRREGHHINHKRV